MVIQVSILWRSTVQVALHCAEWEMPLLPHCQLMICGRVSSITILQTIIPRYIISDCWMPVGRLLRNINPQITRQPTAARLRTPNILHTTKAQDLIACTGEFQTYWVQFDLILFFIIKPMFCCNDCSRFFTPTSTFSPDRFCVRWEKRPVRLIRWSTLDRSQSCWNWICLTIVDQKRIWTVFATALYQQWKF